MTANSDKQSLENLITLHVEGQRLGNYGKMMLQTIYKSLPQNLRESKRISNEIIIFIKDIENQIAINRLRGVEWYKIHRLETHRRIKKIILLKIWENELFLKRILPTFHEDKLTQQLFETMLELATNIKLT